MTPPARVLGNHVDPRLANIVGALALALADDVQAVTESAAGHTAPTPAAVVGLHELLAGRSVDDLRRAVGLTHSGGVRLVDRLVAEGLSERQPGVDARSLAITLTPRGRRLARRTIAARHASLSDVLGVLNSRERTQLTAIAEKLVAAVVTRRLEARDRGESPASGWLCRLCDPEACERPEGRCPAANTASRASALGTHR